MRTYFVAAVDTCFEPSSARMSSSLKLMHYCCYIMLEQRIVVPHWLNFIFSPGQVGARPSQLVYNIQFLV
jgi:hypothetical protein